MQPGRTHTEELPNGRHTNSSEQFAGIQQGPTFKLREGSNPEFRRRKGPTETTNKRKNPVILTIGRGNNTYLKGKFGDRETKILIDTGAEQSVISHELFSKLSSGQAEGI